MVSARIEKSSYFNLIQSGINLASCVWVCSDPPHFMMKICWKFMKNSDSSSNILSYIWWIMIQSSHLSTNTQRHSMLFSVFYHQWNWHAQPHTYLRIFCCHFTRNIFVLDMGIFFPWLKALCPPFHINIHKIFNDYSQKMT